MRGWREVDRTGEERAVSIPNSYKSYVKMKDFGGCDVEILMCCRWKFETCKACCCVMQKLHCSHLLSHALELYSSK